MTATEAHLVAAQKGSLNLVGNAAFLVLSVPVSALHAVDDDGDGSLSRAELRSHADAIGQQVTAGVQLQGPAGALPLQVVMLDIAAPEQANVEQANAAAASQLLVLGRFDGERSGAGVAGADAAFPPGLSLRFSLFGSKTVEQAQDMTITRQQETQWLRFTPDHNRKVLLPRAAAVFADYVQSGAVHVLSGADHLLFLLVVLSSAWSVPTLLGTLSSFTLGHAVTLVASVWAGVAVPGRIAEPAIALTIVGMAAFDVWSRHWARVLPAFVRLLLVFGCALVHGLGLAEALRDLSQWPLGSTAFTLALVGFNLGIEIAQIAVALVAGLAVYLLCRICGVAARQRVAQHGSVLALLVGTFWLMERIAHTA
ncbi:MAG: HupE/UreJ family protein [Rhodoferax sp.]|nr:HupE/UreJ family protein [Rhodoferax sp.]